MNLDKNLIRHWAALFESEEQKMNNENLFLEENDGKQNILTRKMVYDVATRGDTEFEIPRGMTSIEAKAFYYWNSLKKVMIPDSVTSIGDYAFQHCSGLEGVIIPGSVKSIGNFAFNECVGLKNVTIEDGVEEIRDFAFSNCEKLESLTIGKGVKNIYVCAFENCTSLTNVVIPDGVTDIGIGVFQNCFKLESVTIPISLTEIADGMFFGCRSLKSVTIPSSVKEIGKDVFDDCGNLKELIFQGKTEDEVKQMENYPWGIENPESVIRGKHEGDIGESGCGGGDVSEDVEQVDEATIKGFTRDDFENQGVVKHINDEFQRVKLKSWSAEILGSGEDFTIALTDSNSQPPHYDTEYYSADGAYDAWYENKQYEYEEATKIAFECVDHFLKNASDDLQFVTTYKDDEDAGTSQAVYKMVPKTKARKLIDDAIRKLVDQEYNTMRKLPQEKREKFFRDHSWPRFALMAATNNEYLGARTNYIGSYSIDGFGKMLMEIADKIGAYTWEDFENLVGKDKLDIGFDTDDIEKKKEHDQRGEFDSATWNIRESESGNGKEIIDTFTNILNSGLPKPELKKMLASLETLKGKEDMINQTELERLITMYKRELGGDVSEEEMVGEVMSPADIMAMWNKNHADDEKKAAEEKAKKDAEAKARGIKQITINSVGDDGTIKYTIVRNDGRTSEEESKGIGTDDEEFKRTKRMLRTMSGKTPDDLDVFVAMLRRSFDSASKSPIQWYYHFDRGEERRLDDDWYYRPSEDYFGYTPDFIQSIYDAGGRVPGML